jgi:hypothetical protein
MLNLQADFRARFWTLVLLRYRLIWAQARTSSGRLSILFAVYIIGGLLTLVFALGGLGLGVILSTAQGEQLEFFARWLFTGLFVNGVALNLLFGTGTRAAFSEEALRRYPLNRRERFIVRQVIGLFDPIWVLLSAATLGLALGFVLLAGGSIIKSLLAAIIFIIANYLATIVLLSLIGWAMETRTGTRVLGTLTLLTFSFGPLLVAILANTDPEGIWKLFNPILRFTPPGAAAGLTASTDAATIINNFLLLLIWCVGLAAVLQKLEARPQRVQATTGGRIVWQDPYDQVSSLFGLCYGPLINKSLRYHLRCNMIRFSLFSTPLVVMISKYFIQRQDLYDSFFIALGLFFIMSSATAAMMTLNTFGYDAAGIRRYALLPVSFVTALRAGNLTSLLLRGVVVLISLALWVLFYRDLISTWREVVMLVGTALAGLFLYNALGFWTSVLTPKAMDFDAMWNNRLSLGANVVLIGTMIMPFWGIMWLGNRADETMVMRYWWLPLLLLLICIGIYALSFQKVEKILNLRRERLINLLAGARDN